MNKIKMPLAVSPICLSTFVSLSESGTAVGDMLALTSPLRAPMIIDEISFYVKQTMRNVASILDYMGGSIRVRLKTSRYDLTNGHVPLWNFGPVIGETLDMSGSLTGGITTAGRGDTYGFYRWKLPKPLFLRPGDAIFPDFQRQTDTVGGTSKVYISYHGRLMPMDCPIPSEAWIPYVAVWIPTLVSGQTYYVSGQRHFFNKFKGDLHVQRFIQRVQRTNLAAPNELVDQPMYGFDAPQTNPLSVKIIDSTGYQICGDFVPSSYVFNSLRRSLTVKAIMDPNELYTVELSGVPSDASVLPMISMIGTRKEAI